MLRASWVAGWCLALLLCAPRIALAQADGGADLAKQLQNPVADGRDDGFRYTLNVQPIVPISIGPIFPIVYQDDTLPGGGDHSGSGDTLQSYFLSPKAPFHGLIWGLGPVVLLPTSSDSRLGGEKWGVGPTGVDDREDVSQTFLQPVVSPTFSSAVTGAANSEATYDWKAEQWTVPVQIGVSTVLKHGPQTVSLGLNPRYGADGPSSAAEWGLRLVMTFLSPKGKKP